VPDLSNQGVHQFWREYQDPSIYQVICFMESVENWTKDTHHDFDAAITQLGLTLDNLGSIELTAEDDIIKLCAAIKTGRCLRLLMALDMAHPGAAYKVIMHAENTSESEEDISGIFLLRNTAFERLRIMSRVFSAERFKLVTTAIEEQAYD
jgi:intracellular multiplication protein IcmW